MLLALAERNSFAPHPGLSNIMNGVHADGSVNVDVARGIGH